MLTVDHYRKWAEKKRSNLLILFSIIASFIFLLIARYYFKNGLFVSDYGFFNTIIWSVTAMVILTILGFLYQLKIKDWWLFLGLKEIESLISIEEALTGNTNAYNAKHAHRDNLKNGSYRTYAWL